MPKNSQQYINYCVKTGDRTQHRNVANLVDKRVMSKPMYKKLLGDRTGGKNDQY
ncbi:MAG: hypothetical protein KME01_00625 [Chroococcus sp. CMT-3BRIN-NPC107]|nr:hypothetical protein [Chroococcus sp. CMT-3BRIN-NPC107]